jgi:chaperonin GroEL
MRKAFAAVTEGLKNKSKKVGGIDGIRAVATIAANGDEKVGKMLADAFAKVGEDGVITVEEGKSLETEVSIVTGMQFDRGLLSPNFATDLETLEAVLDQPLILIHEDKISNVQTLLPLLEASKESNRPLLIIAEDIEGEALAALVVNKLRGILNVCAVKAPGYGDRRKEILQDLAAVTGATPIMKDGLHDLEKATLEMLGSARRVVIDSANTTIVEGTGEQSEIDNRANHIRKQVENTTSDYDREKLEERLARLVGGIGQISVGGATEAEVKERKARIEDSKAATMAALEEGILPGGGTALLKIASKINLDLPEAQAAGANILLRALREPVRVIAENAGMDGSVIARRVLKTRKFAEGYNALDDTYGDLIEMGVVDPTKVTRTALENAVSVAATLMTTDCLVVDAKSDQDDVPAGMESGMGL